jgi:hypothetical protein
MLGTKSTTEDSAQQRTLETISAMENAYDKNRGVVLKDILDVFSKIKPETHQNLYNQ